MSVVETRFGRIEGSSSDGTEAFLGVPYARAATGSLRMRPPSPPRPWSGVRDTTSFGPDAPQAPSPLEQILGAEPRPQSEDCLSLNVWTPATDGRRRPVMVWIHGGGFATGGSARPLFQGARMARRGDVIVVSINYRLGVLGLLSHPDLRDPETGAVGNWCLLDQIAALRWVREHAERFGGDPEQVTIFGESAGGASVALLCCSPLARGLFRRAVVQSASPLPGTREQGFEAAELVIHALGGPAQLREAPVDTLLRLQERWVPIASRGRTASRPNRDDVVIPLGPDEAIDAGLLDEVELVVGTTRDEFKLFGFMDPKRGTLDGADLEHRLERLGCKDPAEIAGIYGNARKLRGEPDDPWELWCAIQTDRLIRAPLLQWLDRHVARGNTGHAYLMTWESPMLDGSLGSPHGIEVPFVFDTLDSPGMDRFAGGGARAERLARSMQASWLAFAQGRGPGADLDCGWPGYDVDRRPTLVFGADTALEEAPREPERRVWS